MRTFNIVAPPTRTTDNTYFEENKKNELNQLKKLFREVIATGEQDARHKLVRTIIAYTTLGVDTSRLFPEMVLASYTNDLTEKKLIFFYLSIYAEQNPEIAIMAVNTFYKDCIHSDPRIRGLSLKSLSSLKFRGVYDYIHPCLKAGLTDSDGYVRRSAVLGVAKAFRVYKEIKEDMELLDQLYGLIKDEDKLVAVNSIQTLNELLEEQGGVVVSEKMAAYLLNKLSSFPEFAQMIILETASKYSPSTENELIAIMNILDSKLKHSSASIVLGTVKLFLKFASMKEEIKGAIVERIKAPLLLLCTVQLGFELTYVVLEHVRYLVHQLHLQQSFVSHYKTFFCLANEPTYIHSVKIEILEHLTSDTNISDIINQLDEYVNEEEVISVVAIKALGNIAINVGYEECQLIIKIMLRKIEQRKGWVCNKIVLVLENILRKHPKEFHLVQIHLKSLIESVTEDDSKAAILSMISRHSEALPETKEYIEFLIEREETFNLYPATLKKQILNTSLSQFFKSPDYEIKHTLGRVFGLVIKNTETEIHLKDLASMYYMALETDIKSFKQSFMIRREFIGINSSEAMELSLNTFEIPFRKPCQLFLSTQSLNLNFLDFQGEILDPQEELKEIVIDLNPKFKMLEVEDFEEEFTLETDAFEQMWGQLPECACITRIVQEVEGITEDNMEELFRLWRVYTIASGEEDNNMKTYLYAKQAKKDNEQSHVGLMEFEVQKGNKIMTLTTKCEDEQFAGFISKYIEDFLKINEII